MSGLSSFSSLATANTGVICPPVPPPVSTIVIGCLSAVIFAYPRETCVMRHLKHQTHRRQRKNNAGTAVADERQRNTLQRQYSYHRTDINERLDTQPA